MFSPEMGLMVGRMQRQNSDLAILSADLEQANANIRTLNSMVAERDGEISHLRFALQNAQMEAVGRKAQVDAMMKLHSNSPLLTDSGKRFACSEAIGKVKTRLRLIYEGAFDAFGASQLKIANPAGRRLD